MLRPFAQAFAVTAVIVPLGCAFSPSAEMTGGGPSGAANATGTPSGAGNWMGAGGQGGAGNTTPANRDANCGVLDKPAVKLPPDILIVLDRSGSMNDDMNNAQCSKGCGAGSKWALMTPAINQVVSETQNNVNWGLKFFANAGNSSCSVDNNAAVGIGTAKASPISTAIMGQTASNGGLNGGSRTPTRAAMNGAVTYLKGLTDTNNKYILLATDGMPNCMPGNSDTTVEDNQGAIDAVAAAKAAGIPTFVVGIATAGTGSADTTLSSMATAGGLARTGKTPAYYPVTTGAELAEAIRNLVTVAASCRFDVGSPPTDDGTTSLAFIDVYGDANHIPRDQTRANGYDYTDTTMKSIQIYGPYCDQIMAGTIQNVTVAFKCTLP